ncbi:MAG: hypothetical protein VZR53_13240 [Prevotella sp.]|nr:hypothetical protein [Prevotella sp.]
MSIIKKYWWLLSSFIFAAIPVIINWLMLLPSPCEVYEGDWLSFWGPYLGAIVPFLILYFTIRSNEKENNKNRAAQSNYIKCQIDYSRLDYLNTRIADYIGALNEMELGLISEKSKYDPILSRNKVELILKQANQAYNLLDISLTFYEDEKSQKIKEYLNNFQLEYNEVLPDLCYIIRSYIPGDPNENLAKIIEQYPSGNERILKVMKEKGLNIKENRNDIMYELVNNLAIDDLEKELKNFIIYEKEIIDKKMKCNIITED